MRPYALTADAEQDLREIARYTLNRWGTKMLRQYRDGLKDTFDAIGTGKLAGRPFSRIFPDLMVEKYRHHYIFFLTDIRPTPVIIGVIHEKRDIVSRLGERLT